jgi:hypothetical protein
MLIATDCLEWLKAQPDNGVDPSPPQRGRSRA